MYAERKLDHAIFMHSHVNSPQVGSLWSYWHICRCMAQRLLSWSSVVFQILLFADLLQV
jgi:hypothetical protein